MYNDNILVTLQGRFLTNSDKNVEASMRQVILKWYETRIAE